MKAPIKNSAHGHKQSAIVLLTHADSDLLMLSQCRKILPDDFPLVRGINLQSVGSEEEFEQLHSELSSVPIVIMRLLGRTGSVPGFAKIVEYAKQGQQYLIVVSGAGELDPEMACSSTVPPAVLSEVTAYFQAGGVENLAQLLRLIADRFLMTGFGWEAPAALPDHGIYHPRLPAGAIIDDWYAVTFDRDRPTIGLVFYRAHWLSGNLAFVDTLISTIEERRFNALPVFTSSLRAVEEPDAALTGAFQFFVNNNGKSIIDVLINTTSFAIASLNAEDVATNNDAATILSQLNVPVIQAISCNSTFEQWQNSSRGLSPLDTAMNVVLPEFDGRVIGVPISFKQKKADLDAVIYAPSYDRIERVVDLAARMSQLKRKQNKDKRVAFVFTNSNTKASQIGNAVGLDSPQSVIRIAKELAKAGYAIGEFPENGNALIHDLIDRCSYDTTYLSAAQCANAIGKVSKEQYKIWFEQLPIQLQEKMVAQWGPPPGAAYTLGSDLIIAGLTFGNIAIVLQPPRGYGMDANAIYHQPDLPPTHHYYAVYCWLRDVWQSDAMVHVGKHGTLEWLPGKGVGLSGNCFPDAFLGDMPLFYPFIVNDPGEGSQAKRRAHAIVVDHMTPTMTTAETYGVLAELVQLVDEYYQVEMLDPTKLPLLQQQIWDLIKKADLDKDLQLIIGHDHDDDGDSHEHEDHDRHKQEEFEHKGYKHDNDHHDHEKHSDHDHDHWNDELAPHGVPVSLAEMDSVKVSHLIQEIDGYLCELGAAQIRDGLHTLGEAPKGAALIDMLCSLTRLPNFSIPGLQSELARYLGYQILELVENPGQRLRMVSAETKNPTNRLAERTLVTGSDVLELIDRLSYRLFEELSMHDFTPAAVPTVIASALCNDLRENRELVKPLESVLIFACEDLVPKLKRTEEEISNLLRGLEGQYIAAGPSGAPTRGMTNVLPTGRNFYSVDPRSLPSQSAWQVGQQLAKEVLRRHHKETGRYPENVSISVWGTSAMRTHGDDVAEILSLLGVRPVWQAENRRLIGVDVIPLAELGRPRIDVTVRISGFFRDAFQHLIDLIDQAVLAVIALEEPAEQNFVRKHYLEDIEHFVQAGTTREDAQKKSSYRIFGAKPGSYGAGILPLINEGNWQNRDDFAKTYINWGGYAYSKSEHGVTAKEAFRHRLTNVEVALHNQDNREHDIFDSDDYLQFHGGMIATIASLSGKKPRHYFGDTHNPARAVVRDLKEEAMRVFRSRVVNPKWLSGIQKHGYKGGLELTATVDYFFGYDATAEIMDDWMYKQLAEAYALNSDMQQFLQENNPWALNAIAERLLEAAQRQMWSDPDRKTIERLRQAYLNSEALLESRGEKTRTPETVR